MKDVDSAVKISIIICTRNRAEYLRETLVSLGQVQVPRDLPSELVLIDNGSTDDTSKVAAMILPNLPVRYIFDSNPGKCGAINRALPFMQGKILLHTDDDVRFPLDWIEAMCRPIASGKAKAIAGNVAIAPDLQRPWMSGLHKAWLLDYDFSTQELPGVMIGINMAYGREIHQEVPSFDEDMGPGKLGFSDDVLFSWQVQQAGFEIHSAGDTTVVHHFDPSRLGRKQLKERAKREGWVEAYLAYHWLYGKVRLPWLKQMWTGVRLGLYQMLESCREKTAEGCSEKELRLIMKYHFYQYYRTLRRGPRNYDLHGLKRKNGTQSCQTC